MAMTTMMISSFTMQISLSFAKTTITTRTVPGALTGLATATKPIYVGTIDDA